MFIIWGNDNLCEISGELVSVPWPLPENWHGMALFTHSLCSLFYNMQLWQWWIQPGKTGSVAEGQLLMSLFSIKPHFLLD